MQFRGVGFQSVGLNFGGVIFQGVFICFLQKIIGEDLHSDASAAVVLSDSPTNW